MKVLIAIDHSPSAQQVISTVIARPWPTGSTFAVLNIVDLRHIERLHALIEDATRESQCLVEAGADSIAQAGYDVVAKAVPGYPRGAISCYAKEWRADLIMVGSHGHGAVGRFLLGSVAQGVLRTAPCSVEIVRAGANASANPSNAMRVLLATDGSDCSVGATNSIISQPWVKGTAFRILSVEELIAGTSLRNSSLSLIYTPTRLNELAAEAHDHAESAVEVAKGILQHAGLEVVASSSTSVGDPRTVILDTAKQWSADLIVLGSHGRRGLNRFLQGSVSEAVAIHATCSVQVFRDQQAERLHP